MVLIPEDYNPADYSQDFSSNPVLPEGRYLVSAVTVKEKESSTTPGNKYVEIAWSAQDGSHRGLAYSRLNLVNRSERAVLLARNELTAILAAIGRGRPRQFEDILGIPIVITIEGERRTDKPSEMSWSIVKYEPAAAWGSVTPVNQAAPQAAPQQHAQPQPQQPQAPAGTPPWLPPQGQQAPPSSGPTF